MKPAERVKPNPIRPFLREQGVLILDGGLATALEAHGCDLNDPLWSAKILLEEPDLIQQVHREFLEAGADCITTSTYQATFEGLARRGLDDRTAERSFRRSVRLAIRARDEFWKDASNRTGRLRPIVAASVGPFGAFLADGSEYSGEYGKSELQLTEFHEPRWRVLAEGGADVLACETVPSIIETRALVALVRQTPGAWAWISFSCRDEGHLSDGTPIEDAIRACNEEPRVAAVGVNCVPPHLVAPIVRRIREATDKPIVVYPNSGERYDAVSKTWSPGAVDPDWIQHATEWTRLGARAVGGCCRTGASHVAALRSLLLVDSASS